VLYENHITVVSTLRGGIKGAVKVIALAGSPRKQGNSDILADKVLEGAREAGAETEKVYLDDMNIRPIGEVIDDRRQRTDPRGDDDYPRILEQFLDADIVVLATPVYWAGVSAQLKCFIDRMVCYYDREPYVQRFVGKGYVVVTTFGLDDPDHGKWVTEPIKFCVELLRGEYLGDLCVSAYHKGKVRDMPEVLQAALKLGREAVDKLKRQQER
jgi:putative NADPH-quinone reductase